MAIEGKENKESLERAKVPRSGRIACVQILKIPCSGFPQWLPSERGKGWSPRESSNTTKNGSRRKNPTKPALEHVEPLAASAKPQSMQGRFRWSAPE
mmetsp:Transcript_113028/g.176631  ORF Transcript_113028/g.176631 Transcript_113028/m.176631 type:complete len:97 (-) Transcript_113028:250-540(-)